MPDRSEHWDDVYGRRDEVDLTFDLVADRTELVDLSARHPDKSAELQARWQAWADRVGAQPWPVRRSKRRPK